MENPSFEIGVYTCVLRCTVLLNFGKHFRFLKTLNYYTVKKTCSKIKEKLQNSANIKNADCNDQEAAAVFFNSVLNKEFKIFLTVYAEHKR